MDKVAVVPSRRLDQTMREAKMSFIHGNKLPESLMCLMKPGRWVLPSDSTVSLVFGEEPWHGKLYDLERIEFENTGWAAEDSASYLGEADVGRWWPGNIDPSKSVIIGDLCVDQLICLDYRWCDGRPIVVYLGSWYPNRWVKVADSIDDLARRLRL